jgi:sigma-B regulation protein RsbU (phosphoserine phosphatase)
MHQDDVDICGSLVPAREVGGDLYDYFIRDEKLFFCIGDVSGKGVPAAMLMAVTHGLFRSASAHESNPARIMQYINEVSCQGNDSNMFVTMFIGVLDLPTGHLRYCDAGHDAPFITVDGQWSMTDIIPHLPVGVFDDVKYGVQKTSLQPDSTIFLYTDGLTEAKNEGHEQFGLERTKAVLNTCSDKEPQQVLEMVTEAVGGFVKDAEQSDDLTMLAIRYTPKQFQSTLTETLVLKNDVHEVTRFSSFMKSVTEKLGIETSLARKLRLAVEEAVVNVINYAYPAGTEGDVTIKMMSDGNKLHCQIIDAGVPFDPTAKKKVDTTLSVEERQIGGLGIHLVRELMDSINYEREDGKNILTLTKNIKQ